MPWKELQKKSFNRPKFLRNTITSTRRTRTSPWLYRTGQGSPQPSVCLVPPRLLNVWCGKMPLENWEPRLKMELLNGADNCASKRVLFIICSVTNSHSVMWGTSNARGNEFEEFRANLDLCVLNHGSRSTFLTKREWSLCDVILVHSLELHLVGR
jgi:hypothetical protein